MGVFWTSQDDNLPAPLHESCNWLVGKGKMKGGESMHTYRKIRTIENDKPVDEYQVGFLESDTNADGESITTFNIVKRFKNEIQAICFVNFLNGGNQDITLIKELIEQK